MSANFDYAKLNITERQVEAAKECFVKGKESVEGFNPEMARFIRDCISNGPVILFGLFIACTTAYGNIKSNLDDNELIREMQDLCDLNTNDKQTNRTVVNFSSVRMVGGLIMAEYENEVPHFAKVNRKQGNPWISNKFPDTIAGKIGKELYETYEAKEWSLPAKHANHNTIAEVLKSYWGQASGYTDEAKTKIQEKIKARQEAQSKIGKKD